MAELLEQEKQKDLSWQWLFGSLSLNFLLLQLTILILSDGGWSLAQDFQTLFMVGWVLLSLLLAGLLGWLVIDSYRWEIQSGWRGLLLIGLVGVLGLFASASPHHQWFGKASLALKNYPLAGLELKSLAILLSAATLSFSRRPAKEQSGELENPQDGRNVRLAGSIPLASAAIVLILAAAIPIISSGESRLVEQEAEAPEHETVSILPSEGYQLPVSYQAIGPALLDAGAIDLDQFQNLFEQANTPLTVEQLSILTEGSQEAIVINRSNARFLLNLFWAVGLTNENPVLLEGQMQKAADGDIGRFASTGGWTLGSKSGAELFASRNIIELTDEQQTLVEKVADQLYRPCCNNPTSFPDCNHGMAMLGMLELMASQGATETEMWQAAKYVNAYWFTSQMTEVAMLYDAAKGIPFSEIPGEEALGPALFSGSGFRNLHTYLQSEGLLQGESGGGASCGV